MERAVITNLASTLRNLRSNTVFELIVVAIIIFFGLFVGAKTYEETTRLPKSWMYWIGRSRYFLWLRLQFACCRKALTATFFKSGWNIFDFVIVVRELNSSRWWSKRALGAFAAGFPSATLSFDCAGAACAHECVF